MFTEFDSFGETIGGYWRIHVTPAKAASIKVIQGVDGLSATTNPRIAAEPNREEAKELPCISF
jgi:hypothetical protein